MRYLKVEDVAAENTIGSDVEMSSNARTAYDQQQNVMKSVCMVYDVPPEMLLEALEHSDEDTSEGVQAVIWDPMYNTRQTGKLSNLNYNQLNLKDMKNFVQFSSSLVELGVHGHMFCPALQFNTKLELLVGE